MILWSQSLTAPSHPVFRDAERFVVNILADDQVEISNRFARGSADKFAGCPTVPGLGGVPLIEGCAAYLECRRMDSFPGGDHVVFLGQVERMERTGRQPLVFGGGRYLVAQPHDMGLPAAAANIARLHAVRLATRALVDLSDELDETLGLGVWGNTGPTIVRWEEASEPVSDNLRTGLVLRVLTSATGRAFAAGLPPEMTASFIDMQEAAQRASPAGEGVSHTRTTGASAWRIDSACQRSFDAPGRHRCLSPSLPYGRSISALSVPVFAPDPARWCSR